MSLDAPQGVREVAALDEAEDRPEGVPLPEPGVVATVEQLEGLHQKLHLADPARPQLDVQALVPFGLERAVNLALHGPTRGEDPPVNPRLIDIGTDQVEEPPPDALVAGAEACLDQRLALPEEGALGIVGAVAVQRQDQGPAPALGAQAQVHAERVTFLGDALEGGDDLARQPPEVLAVREGAARAAGGLAVLRVHEDEVDIGGVVELLAAELAHADDGEPGRLSTGRVGGSVPGVEGL